MSSGPAPVSRSTGSAGGAAGAMAYAVAGAGRGASSRTTCALIPPKPNALTAARRGAPGGRSHGTASVTGANRLPARAGCGSSTCRVGGSVSWCSASAALISPATPAAGMV